MRNEESVNRRTFASRIGSFALLAFAAGSSVVMVGCSGVFSQIMSWIPIGLSAIDSIVTLLGPLVPPGATAILVIVKAAFADLSAAITEYNNDTNPADKSSVLAKIKTLLKDIADNFQSFLNALNLGNNPIVAIVIGLANIILAAIAGFMGQLPASAGTKLTSPTVHVGNQTQPVLPKVYKNVGDFKRDWNAVAVKYNHPEAELK
jgi:hypothetical protein